MPTAEPTKQITYKISSFTPIEIGERWTNNVVEAQKAYDRGFYVEKVDIVRATVSTGQTVTTGLATEWRGQ